MEAMFTLSDGTVITLDLAASADDDQWLTLKVTPPRGYLVSGVSTGDLGKRTDVRVRLRKDS